MGESASFTLSIDWHQDRIMTVVKTYHYVRAIEREDLAEQRMEIARSALLISDQLARGRAAWREVAERMRVKADEQG